MKQVVKIHGTISFRLKLNSAFLFYLTLGGGVGRHNPSYNPPSKPEAAEHYVVVVLQTWTITANCRGAIVFMHAGAVLNYTRSITVTAAALCGIM